MGAQERRSLYRSAAVPTLSLAPIHDMPFRRPSCTMAKVLEGYEDTARSAASNRRPEHRTAWRQEERGSQKAGDSFLFLFWHNKGRKGTVAQTVLDPQLHREPNKDHFMVLGDWVAQEFRLLYTDLYNSKISRAIVDDVATGRNTEMRTQSSTGVLYVYRHCVTGCAKDRQRRCMYVNVCTVICM